MRRDPDCVKWTDVANVITELDAARPGKDHVNLFSLVVAVRECLPSASTHAVEGEPDGLSAEVFAREAGLLNLGEAELRCRVFDLAEVLDRVAQEREANPVAL